MLILQIAAGVALAPMLVAAAGIVLLGIAVAASAAREIAGFVAQLLVRGIAATGAIVGLGLLLHPLVGQ